jgi:3D (Asp-Asp-Asp) domain-containing protein
MALLALMAWWILLGCLVARGEAQPLRVTVTAYSQGILTAAGTRPRVGILALSRDVERALQVRFGDQVSLGGLGTYTFGDRMPRQWHRRVDLYLPPHARARHFGIRHGVRLTRLP